MNKIDPIFYVLLAPIIGQIIIFVLLPYVGIKEILLKFGNANNNPDLIFVMLTFYLYPLMMGLIFLIISKKIWNSSYKNIGFFRDMIEFFGGPKVWKYSLFLGIMFSLAYIILSMVMSYQVTPYYIIGIFISVFIVVLVYGERKKPNLKK